MKQKIRYLLTCARNNLAEMRFVCPSCGYSCSEVVDRKYFVTSLRRCKQCHLLFRAPTTTADENASFYQEEYAQGFTTDYPNSQQLKTYLDKGFSGTEKDYSTYLEVVRGAGGESGNRLFDFGCSWGYGSYQFQQDGFDVESFEISVPRANFARANLDVKVYSSLSEVSGSFDIFFSSHVLEHVPSVQEAIDFGFSILRPGGLFIAFTPNGSAAYRRKDPKGWHKLWGLVHPNFLDDVYYKYRFSDSSFFLSSNPYSIQDINKWKIDQGGGQPYFH